MDTGETIELLPGDATMVRLLRVYAETRLTPDLSTSARIRARVLAVAHRRAELAGADPSRALLSHASPSTPASTARRMPGRRLPRRLVVGLLAATLTMGATGVALASRAGGPLYPTRLWSETLTLPADPSARAVAQLDRLERRLTEALEAAQSGDVVAVEVALEAYQDILEQASHAAVAAGDDVAAAVLEAGVGRNLSVLQALSATVPSAAVDAIRHAIERSGTAIDRVRGIGPTQPAGQPSAAPPDQGGPDTGGGTGGTGGTGGEPAPTATQGAAADPKPSPSPAPKPPDAAPTPTPDHQPRPESTDAPRPTDRQGDRD
jgi:hypothetical protein